MAADTSSRPAAASAFRRDSPDQVRVEHCPSVGITAGMQSMSRPHESSASMIPDQARDSRLDRANARVP